MEPSPSNMTMGQTFRWRFLQVLETTYVRFLPRYLQRNVAAAKAAMEGIRHERLKVL